MTAELRKKATVALQNQGVAEVNQETWTGHHSYNIIASSNGEVLIDNSADLTRGLINNVLFSPEGEERLSVAMSGEKIIALKKIKNPTAKIKVTNFQPLSFEASKIEKKSFNFLEKLSKIKLEIAKLVKK